MYNVFSVNVFIFFTPWPFIWRCFDALFTHLFMQEKVIHALFFDSRLGHCAPVKVISMSVLLVIFFRCTGREEKKMNKTAIYIYNSGCLAVYYPPPYFKMVQVVRTPAMATTNASMHEPTAAARTSSEEGNMSRKLEKKEVKSTSLEIVC